MTKAFMKFYRRHVVEKDDRNGQVLFWGAVLLLAAGAALAAYDIVSLAEGTSGGGERIPFLLSAALTAFGLVTLAILRIGASKPRS